MYLKHLLILRERHSSLQTLRGWRVKCFEAGVIQQDRFIFAKWTALSTPPSAAVIGRRMDEIMEMAKVHRITTHGLRHTKATLLSEADVKPADLAAILGHANAQFTYTHYVHATEKATQEAEAKFAALTNL